MRRVTRGLTILCTLLATLVVALPAAGSDGRALKGVVVSVSPAAVAFKDAKNVVTTCARAAKSPSLDGFSAGDHVQAACARDHGRLVLRRIRHVGTASGPANDAEPTKFGGVITALSDTSITLHDGDRDLTCSIGAGSPSTAEVKVGVHARVACANGALVMIAPVGSGEPGHAYEGTVTALSTASITVHSEQADATCGVGGGSPSLAEVKVGDRVLIGCKAGTNQLLLLKRLAAAKPAGSPDEHHKTLGASGTVSAVSAGSLTVHGDGGEVTCTVGDGSPSLAGLHVGDVVKIGCLDGVLKAVVTPPGAVPPTGDHHTVTTVAGTLSVLSDSAVTVHSGEKGDVSCTVGSATPRLGDFHVGDRVGMACVDGVVAKLVKL
jgi:hypothetical protein